MSERENCYVFVLITNIILLVKCYMERDRFMIALCAFVVGYFLSYFASKFGL